MSEEREAQVRIAIRHKGALLCGGDFYNISLLFILTFLLICGKMLAKDWIWSKKRGDFNG